MAFNIALRQIARSSPTFTRTFQTGSMVRGGDGHHEHEGYEAYLHAKHMYNLPGMKHQRLKIGLAVSSIVFGGIGIGVLAIYHQQNKRK